MLSVVPLMNSTALDTLNTMSLTALLDDIDTETIVKRWVEKAAGAEKNLRDRRRMPLFSAATLYTPDGRKKGVMCRDISKQGIGIIQHGEPPESETPTLAVEIQKQVVHLNVKFRWTRDMGNGWWTSGASLTETSSKNASLALLRFSRMVERRMHQRYSFCHPFTVLPNLQPQDEYVDLAALAPEDEASALSLDISLSGMRLLHCAPIDYKKTIHIVKPRTDYMLTGHVASHRDLGHGYSVVGVHFAPSKFSSSRSPSSRFSTDDNHDFTPN